MTPPVGAIVGPLLIFACLAFILFGAFTAQLYYYYVTFRHDNRSLKIYVWLMGLIETLHTTLCLIFLYWYLVTQFGDVVNGLDRIHWSIEATIIVEVVIVFMAQGLYCWRIWHVSDGMVVVTAIPGFLSFARFCGGLTCFILSVPSHRWETLISHVVFKGALTATYATELFTDVTISVIFIFCLLRRRSSAMHFKRTNDIVEKLVYYVINTAIANIICSIGVIVTLHAAEGSLAFIGIIEMRCKLYANVMMALWVAGLRYLSFWLRLSVVIHDLSCRLNARTVIFKNRDIELTALGGRNRVPKTQVHIYTDTIVHRTSNVTDHNSGDSENQGLEILDVKGAQHIIS